MSAGALLIGLVLAQATPALTVEGGSQRRAERIDVAFEELSQGRTEEALAFLRKHPEPRHPAVQINLGTAYARLGQPELAKRSYRRAAGTHERYYLEKADGTWIDSDEAAKIALNGLATGELLALK